MSEEANNNSTSDLSGLTLAFSFISFLSELDNSIAFSRTSSIVENIA